MFSLLPTARLPRVLVVAASGFMLVIWANLAATQAANADLPALASPAPVAIPTAPVAQTSARVPAPAQPALPEPQALPLPPNAPAGRADLEPALPGPLGGAAATGLLTLMGFALVAAWTAAGRTRPALSPRPSR